MHSPAPVAWIGTLRHRGDATNLGLPLLSSNARINLSLSRPRRKSRSALLPTSCLIGEPAALEPGQGNLGALHVIHTKTGAGILPEIKFGHVAVQMLAFDVLVGADHAALEDGEKAFEGVHMHRDFAFLAGIRDILINAMRVGGVEILT